MVDGLLEGSVLDIQCAPWLSYAQKKKVTKIKLRIFIYSVRQLEIPGKTDKPGSEIFGGQSPWIHLCYLMSILSGKNNLDIL